MKIVIAPDSYKESLSALEVATEIEAGFLEIFPEASCLKVPMADGGEGTVAAMVDATAGSLVETCVTDPLGAPVQAFYGLTGEGETAVIEMAAASGLALVDYGLRNPLKTTTYGTGELIKAVLDTGIRHLIVGIGGSATNDGGAGMLQALGAELLDVSGQQIGYGGGCLADLTRINIENMDSRIKGCRIEVACDVSNPLTGPQGASAIFGPQKGASEQMVAELDRNLGHYAKLIKRDLGVDVDQVQGAGAAGGLGAGLMAFMGAQLRSGVDIVVDAVGLDAAICDADLVITGEGRMDSQTINGKTPVGVAKIAKRCQKPVIGIAGSLAADVTVVHDNGIDAVFSILHRICGIDDALGNAAENLRSASRNIAAAIKIGKTF